MYDNAVFKNARNFLPQTASTLRIIPPLLALPLLLLLSTTAIANSSISSDQVAETDSHDSHEADCVTEDIGVFSIKPGIDVSDSSYELAANESFPIIVENTSGKSHDFELAWRIICPAVNFDEISYHSAGQAAPKASASVDFSPMRDDFTYYGNTFPCQVIPVVYFYNNIGQELMESGSDFFIEPTKNGLSVIGHTRWEEIVKENKGVPASPVIEEKDLSKASKDASKTTYNVRFKLYWQINFEDASTSVGDDYYTSNSDKVAGGVLYQVYSSYNGVYYTSLTSGYADLNGYTSYFNVNSSYYYLVKMSTTTNSTVSGNTNVVYVRKCGSRVCYRGTDSGFTSKTFTRNLSPGYFTSSATYTLNNGSVDAMANATAASTYAIIRHNGGMSKTYRVYNSPVNYFDADGVEQTSSGNFHYGQSGVSYVYISHCDPSVPSNICGAKRKYTIAHEMGHALMYHKRKSVTGGESTGAVYTYNDNTDCVPDGDVDPDTDCRCATSSSGGHSMTSMEYHSAGLNEGWAQFFAAETWNNDYFSSCKFKYYKNIDYDGDGVVESKPIINCESPDYGTPGWMENYCGSPYAGYANEWDWLLTFWDTVTDQSVSFNTMLETVADTLPTDKWGQVKEYVDGDYEWVPSFTKEQALYCNLRDSAYSNGILCEFLEESQTNGVDYYSCPDADGDYDIDCN